MSPDGSTPRPSRVRWALLVAGLLALAAPFVQKNPAFGTAGSEWPWSAARASGGAAAAVDLWAWFAAGCLATLVGLGVGGARLLLLLGAAATFAAVRLHSLPTGDRPLPPGSLGLAWTIAPALVGGGALAIARGRVGSRGAAAAALLGGAVLFFACYATWFSAQDGRPVVLRIVEDCRASWRGLGSESSPLARSHLAIPLWKGGVPLLLAALTVLVSLATAALARPGAARPLPRAAARFAYGLQLLWWVVPVAAAILVLPPGPEAGGDGWRHAVNTASAAVIGEGVGHWLLLSALLAEWLAPRCAACPPRETAFDAGLRRRLPFAVAALLAAAFLVGWIASSEAVRPWPPHWNPPTAVFVLVAAFVAVNAKVAAGPASPWTPFTVGLVAALAWTAFSPRVPQAMAASYGADPWVPGVLCALIAAGVTVRSAGGVGRSLALVSALVLLAILLCPTREGPAGSPSWLTGELPAFLWQAVNGSLPPFASVAVWVPPLLATAGLAAIGVASGLRPPARWARWGALTCFLLVIAYPVVHWLIAGKGEEAADGGAPGGLGFATTLLAPPAFALALWASAASALSRPVLLEPAAAGGRS